MTPLEYIGRHDEVEIAETGQRCKRGEVVEVPKDLAEVLLDQPTNWQAPTTPADTDEKDND